MANKEAIKTVLLKAADILEEEGWFQGDYAEGLPEDLDLRPDGSELFRPGVSCARCAWGAIGAAAVREGLPEKVIDVAVTRVCVEVQDVLGVWNDRDNRTKEQVVKTLRDVANAL